jgi:hypothetical protein
MVAHSYGAILKFMRPHCGHIHKELKCVDGPIQFTQPKSFMNLPKYYLRVAMYYFCRQQFEIYIYSFDGIILSVTCFCQIDDT